MTVTQKEQKCVSTHNKHGVHEANYVPSDPVLEALHVFLDHSIGLWSPRGNHLAVGTEVVDRLATKFTDIVDGTLQRVAVVFHQDNNHVVRVTSSLFHVI